jgi:hypothetical protein
MVMAMAMEEMGERIDEQWWWISFGELQMDMVDSDSVWRKMALFFDWLPSQNV